MKTLVTPQLIGLVGVVLLSGLFYSPSASALTPRALKSEELSALNQTEAKLKEVDSSVNVKLVSIKDKEEEVNKEKEEVKKVEAKKLSLDEQIAKAKEEVEALKAEIAEKKRLKEEQERIAAEQAAAALVAPIAPSTPSYARGMSSNNVGNRYGWGQCTWYVYNRRPDIGSFWGNASAWIGSALADGYSTGSAPQVGAIAHTYKGIYGHVAYVEAVSGNMVTVSEMNYQGVGVVSSRTVLASEFQYIY